MLKMNFFDFVFGNKIFNIYKFLSNHKIYINF